ncbi:hypothetical protein [Brevundimonas sp. UBA5866]|nr:hypothetical protein [Brevundimonas sp. UBA5866]
MFVMLTEVIAAGMLAFNSGAPQVAPVVTPPSPSQESYRLEDLTVTGRPRDALIRNFVENVADPVPGRKLARWNDPVCVGVVNLGQDLSQYLIDRISDVAADLGVRTGQPGCKANVHIVATDQPREVAARFMSDRKRDLIPNATGVTNRAMRHHFTESDAPIRWWYLSEVVVTQTGQRAFRMPGDTPMEDGRGEEVIFVPKTAPRLTEPYSDSMRQTYIIIDPTQLTHMNSLQLADYLAVVALAQISPTADTESYNSILNAVDDSSAAPSLTQWDRAYLSGLYSATQTPASNAASRLHIRSEIARAADRLSQRAEN